MIAFVTASSVFVSAPVACAQADDWTVHQVEEWDFHVRYPADWRVIVAGSSDGAGWEPEVLFDDEVYKVTFLESGNELWPGHYQMRVLEGPEGTDLDVALSRFDLSDLWEGEPRDTVVTGEPARTWVRWSADALIREFVLMLPRGILHVSYVEETPNDTDLEAHRRIYERITASIVVGD